MFLFLAGAVSFGRWILPWLTRRVSRLHISQGVLAFSIVILLVYAMAAELAGSLAAIIGAFLAGLMFARTPEKTIIEQGVSTLAYGFFVPIFFISIGLNADLRNLQPGAVWFILAVTLVAIGGKLFGAAAGARLGGLPLRELIQLGVGMVARGEVTLIIAAVGVKTGLITGSTLPAIVIAVLLSTLVTPPLLRWVFIHLREKTVVISSEQGSKL